MQFNSIYDKVAGIDTPVSQAGQCIERPRQIPRALDTLERLISCQEEAITELERRLQPFMDVLTTDQAVQGLPQGSTPIVNLIDGFSSRVSRGNDRLTELLARLEI